MYVQGIAKRREEGEQRGTGRPVETADWMRWKKVQKREKEARIENERKYDGRTS